MRAVGTRTADSGRSGRTTAPRRFRGGRHSTAGRRPASAFASVVRGAGRAGVVGDAAPGAGGRAQPSGAEEGQRRCRARVPFAAVCVAVGARRHPFTAVGGEVFAAGIWKIRGQRRWCCGGGAVARDVACPRSLSSRNWFRQFSFTLLPASSSRGVGRPLPAIQVFATRGSPGSR